MELGAVMKKLLLLLCIVMIIWQCQACAKASKAVEFRDLYHEVVGFSDSETIYKPIGRDTVFLLSNIEYQRFMEEYFEQRALLIEPPDEDKAVVYLQFSGEWSSAYPYTIKSIESDGETLTVTVQKEKSDVKVDPAPDFDGIFYWVVFLELDKTHLGRKMDIAVVELI